MSSYTVLLLKVTTQTRKNIIVNSDSNLQWITFKPNNTEIKLSNGWLTELAECEDQYTFKLVFHGGGGRTYVLAADSQESLEVWMKALARASYDYLKLMVAELQKQLDELNGQHLSLDSCQSQKCYAVVCAELEDFHFFVYSCNVFS